MSDTLDIVGIAKEIAEADLVVGKGALKTKMLAQAFLIAVEALETIDGDEDDQIVAKRALSRIRSLSPQ